MQQPELQAQTANPSRLISRRSLLVGGIAASVLLAAGCRNSRPDIDLSRLELGYPDDTIFTTPHQLVERIEDPALRILDCSELPSYRSGHIPGATHVWWQDTIELHNPVYGMLVNADGRAELTRNAGITPVSEVVCYDDHGGTYAARIAWVLRYMGFHTVRLLAGGTAGWRAAGFDLTRDEPDVPDGGIPDIFDESIVAHPQDILGRLDEPGLVILDTRTAGERDETWNGQLREGIIPGSVWLPRDQFSQARQPQVPLPAAALAAHLDAAFDLDATAEVIVYGLHGTLAALPYYQLLALARFHVRLYDGSWAQWGADPALPIEPQPG